MGENAFREKVEAGKFVVTAELCPPKGVSLENFLRKARLMKGCVDAVNVTDNQRSVMRLASIPAASLLLKEGLETIFQLTCRDRNRLALQSDLLGAHVLGLRNVLALTGDLVVAGDHPGAKPVFDLDSVQLLEAISSLNAGFDIQEQEIGLHTDFYAGAAVDPGAEPMEPQMIKFEQKVEAGARYFQTQAVFDPAVLDRFMSRITNPDVRVLGGVLVLKSSKMARFLNENVPGVQIDEATIRELETDPNPPSCGIRLAVDLIRKMRGICHGVHIMSIGKEELVPEILKAVKKQ